MQKNISIVRNHDLENLEWLADVLLTKPNGDQGIWFTQFRR